MKYIFIDTNIYIYCALITKGNYTTQTIDALNRAINTKQTKLLMPEIIKLEFEKKANNILENDVISNINKVKKEIQNISFPEYLGEEKSQIEKKIDKLLQERIENLKRVSNKIIKDIEENQNTILIDLTSEIFLKAYKRALRGDKPYSGQICNNCGNMEYPINADCIIIESLINYLKNTKISENDELIFCSNNTRDFAEFNQEEKIHYLHKDIKKDINLNVKYYNNLPELLKKEFESKIDNIEITEIKNIELTSKLDMIIFKIGIPAYSLGAQYLKTAVMIILNNTNYLNNTRNLYSKIADMYQTTSISVQSAITHSIQAFWDYSNTEFFEGTAVYTMIGTKRKPTNLEFIAMLADKISSELNA